MKTTLTSSQLEHLIDRILMDAEPEEETWCFLEEFETAIRCPCGAAVAGTDVVVTGFDYGGDERRGITATCWNPVVARKYDIAVVDVEFTPPIAPLAAYRKWMGLPPYPKGSVKTSRAKPVGKVKVQLPLPGSELVVTSVEKKRRIATCRLPGGESTFALPLKAADDAVPGEMLTVDPQTGRITGRRLDAKALGLRPLKLTKNPDIWKPVEQEWGEDPGEPLPDWVRAQIVWGPRYEYEMEQVVPGMDGDEDPIFDAVELSHSGDKAAAEKALMQLCEKDLRCLDAHAHLGNLLFNKKSNKDVPLAMRHYETGTRIGELSLGASFDGLLPWSMMDNRPFLRCLHGLGLCHWRLGEFEEAAKIFERMLWLNPEDNQGARFNLREVKDKKRWSWESD